MILSGLSAGSICWFEEGVTDSIPGDLTRLEGLGLLSGSHCPHYDGEADRRPSYHRLIQSGQIGGGIAADDGAALHYVDGVFHRAVSSRPEAKAYEVQAVEGHVVETVIPTVYGGSGPGYDITGIPNTDKEDAAWARKPFCSICSRP